jgi:transcriptional regulator with XRE-family HTH domain
MSTIRFIKNPRRAVDTNDPAVYTQRMELQTIIHERGHSQNWVARQIGVDKATFSRIVHGRSALDARKVKPLADLLRVPVSRVLAALNGATAQTGDS